MELKEFYLPLGCDDGSDAGTAIELWGKTMQTAAAQIGVDVQAALTLTGRLQAQGFRNVREVRLKSPIGPWAKGKLEKEVGIMGLRDLYEHLEGISAKLFSGLGYSLETTKEMCEAAKADMLKPRVCACQSPQLLCS
jgi:roadblock/LC7 domain-containing protein